MPDGFSLAREYHRNLPERIRDYLRRERGIADEVLDLHLLGWNGARITIPIPDRAGSIAFFKLAKSPDDKTESPKMLATRGTRAELYGWERVLVKPDRIIICEGEFDRLVLESRGFPAVTSTGGASTFRPEWAGAFREIPHVYVCLDNDDAGHEGAKRIARLIPQAQIVRLPEDVGEGGDVTDYFVRLGQSRDEFLGLLEQGEPLPEEERVASQHPVQPEAARGRDGEVERLKASVAIEEFISRYVPLRRSGQNFIARCPFHEDRNPSFVVYPQTQSFYCFGCRERGDVLSFLMSMEHLTFPEALNVLRQLSPNHGGQHQPGSRKSQEAEH
jgi:DNA primase